MARNYPELSDIISQLMGPTGNQLYTPGIQQGANWPAMTGAIYRALAGMKEMKEGKAKEEAQQEWERQFAEKEAYMRWGQPTPAKPQSMSDFEYWMSTKPAGVTDEEWMMKYRFSPDQRTPTTKAGKSPQDLSDDFHRELNALESSFRSIDVNIETSLNKSISEIQNNAWLYADDPNKINSMIQDAQKRHGDLRKKYAADYKNQLKRLQIRYKNLPEAKTALEGYTEPEQEPSPPINLPQLNNPLGFAGVPLGPSPGATPPAEQKRALGQGIPEDKIPPGSPTAINPKTKERVVLINGRWIPVIKAKK